MFSAAAHSITDLNFGMFLVSSRLGQEPGERHPLPDHAGFRPGHGHRSGALPAAEERTEQADDWRVLGEQQAAIQQGRSRVSRVSSLPHHACQTHLTRVD